MVVTSLGMACAIAPLTTAVLTSVNARQTGLASGLNSALARVGGLIATALLGAVLVGRGAALISGFHGAMIVGTLASAVSGICAFLLIPGAKASRPKVGSS
jgi:hypothetical protein